jgi:nitroreductase
MSITNIIQTRRSVYPEQYNDKIIPDAEIMQMLENSNFAPTHKLTQPWRFKIISSDKKIELGNILAEWSKNNSEQFSDTQFRKIIGKTVKSSHIIAVCMQRDPKKSVPEWEEIAATAMAVQNIWLTASELGIGMYWSSPKAIESETVKNFLELANEESCLGFLYMGYPESIIDQKANRSPISEKIVWL